MKKYVFLLLFGLPFLAPAQVLTIRGKLMVRGKDEPIPYANIGIVNQNAGTLSDEDGGFVMHLSASYRDDSLTIAALGYERAVLPIAKLAANEFNRITLSEKPVVLNELVVRAKGSRRRTVVLGNPAGGRKLLGGRGIYCGKPETAGGAVALLIEPDATPYEVLSARLKLLHNAHASFKVRIRLLDVDAQTGQPGTDLFGHSLILTSGIRQGWLEADLSGYGIRLQHPRFFLVFEWIEDSERRNRTKELMDAFAREHPDRYYERREVVNGKEEIQRGLNGFLEGTFFAVSRKTDATDHFICFTRDSSLDHWSSSQSVLTATVTLGY